jgi:hypothetical protein
MKIPNTGLMKITQVSILPRLLEVCMDTRIGTSLRSSTT